jgi:hypothetical protein
MEAGLGSISEVYHWSSRPLEDTGVCRDEQAKKAPARDLSITPLANLVCWRAASFRGVALVRSIYRQSDQAC